MTKTEAMALISAEYDRATAKFGQFNSPHEGIAVVEEEFLELRQEVFWGKDDGALQTEAVQLGAMALRFLTDVDR